ncbi:RNA methyltransferase [Chloroflexi bacterium TSY]|nr:RNA methyltransferase [Chloroflexi bacterium TSY]
MAYRERPEGLLAVASQHRRYLSEAASASDAFYVVAESIEKPANLGAILRSADGAGADGLILCDPCTDIFNPNVVRASVGTFFGVPVLESSSQEAIEWCRQRKIQTLAATPQADVLYTDVDLSKPTAVVVGTEQYGLSDQWLAQADVQIKLPMFGQVNSLNVAIAASVLLYEVVRQRTSTMRQKR